ncbi:MAG: hypothetical protein HC837_17790, partial [Chloroflexaceae bacterium]|nr:hypothetical protein [Chloroflexaceae bacterium]
DSTGVSLTQGLQQTSDPVLRVTLLLDDADQANGVTIAALQAVNDQWQPLTFTQQSSDGNREVWEAVLQPVADLGFLIQVFDSAGNMTFYHGKGTFNVTVDPPVERLYLPLVRR